MHSKCCFSLQLYSPLALFRQCNLPPCGKIGYIVWNDTTNVFDHAYLCFILFVLHVCLIRCFTIFHFYHTQKFTLFRSVSICSYCCSVQFCIANNGYIKDLCLLLLSPFSHPELTYHVQNTLTLHRSSTFLILNNKCYQL
jgi:hypothetical protein